MVQHGDDVSKADKRDRPRRLCTSIGPISDRTVSPNGLGNHCRPDTDAAWFGAAVPGTAPALSRPSM